MEKALHPPGLGQAHLRVALLGHHGRPHDIELCPGEVEQITPSLTVHQQLTCVTTLAPQRESPSIDH
eukprot:2333976-Prorocentrum_lima.AAC.1